MEMSAIIPAFGRSGFQGGVHCPSQAADDLARAAMPVPYGEVGDIQGMIA